MKKDSSEIEESLSKKVETYELHSNDLQELDLKHRVEQFAIAQQKYQERIRDQTNVDIKITLPDGKQVDGKKFVTRPIDVANGISKGLAQVVIASKVNGQVWDLGM